MSSISCPSTNILRSWATRLILKRPPTLITYQSLKKAVKVQLGEKETTKAARLVKVEAAKAELEKAKFAESTFACLA